MDQSRSKQENSLHHLQLPVFKKHEISYEQGYNK